MTNYLVRGFSGFVSEALSRLLRKPWFRSFPFPIFRNYSGDFSICFSEMGYINQLFQFLIGCRPLR